MLGLPEGTVGRTVRDHSRRQLLEHRKVWPQIMHALAFGISASVRRSYAWSPVVLNSKVATQTAVAGGSLSFVAHVRVLVVRGIVGTQ